jgi:hypothetical protein
MKAGLNAFLFVGAALGFALPSSAQAPREDVIWARSTGGAPITLDGVLDESAWAAAESKVIRYRYDSGLPGSGWKDELASPITGDSTYAIIKLVTVGNQLYMGAFVRDSSVGGGGDFNRFDGFIMSLKDHASLGRPAPTMEYLYSWWAQTLPPGPGPVAGSPYFGGRWATPPWGSPRTEEQIAAWDAVTRVHGLSNSDASPDTGYTVEMRFDLGVMGYDVTQLQGDIVEWNISVYDCDWRWPGALPARISANRTWWEDPWGNVSWYGQVEIHARPDVTIASGAVPAVGPGVIVPNAAAFPAPTIDGLLDESVWSLAPSLDLRYGDDALRDSYGPIAKWRSGQYQPMVNGGQAAVLDPADATVRWFFKEDTMYFAFDVRDQAVQYAPNFSLDRWDGFTVTVNDRQATNADHAYIARGLSFIVGPTGGALAQDYLPYLRDSLQGAKVALVLKPGTTVDTVGTSPDVGYTAELCVVLTKLGYPPGRGDGSIFFGVDHHDGDSFTPFTFSYGTRIWWQRERPGTCCPAWAYLDPTTYVVGVEDRGPLGAGRFALLGNHPNPFRFFTEVRFALAEPSAITLEVFDLQGRRVAWRDLGVRQAGVQQAAFHEAGLRPGLYLYRLRAWDPASGAVRATLSGKMMRLR